MTDRFSRPTARCTAVALLSVIGLSGPVYIALDLLTGIDDDPVAVAVTSAAAPEETIGLYNQYNRNSDPIPEDPWPASP